MDISIKGLLGTSPEKFKLENISGPNGIIATVTGWAIDLAAGVAVIFIIIGGWQYLTSMGNEEQASKGKQTLTWAIIGLMLIIGARLIIDFLQAQLM